MGNPVKDASQQQNAIHYQYFLLILLTLFHGYYNHVRLHGWLNGSIGLLKETATVVIIVQFCFGNYYASRDSKRHIAERNVRRATHVANITGVVFTAFGLIWGFYVLTTHDSDTIDNENAFNIMNNKLYLVVLMGVSFFIQLCSLKPGTGELEFLKYSLRYPWHFIWPSMQSEIFRYSENIQQE
ncbi:uncharacterized protein TRIVIDRAFT_216133 [Trichoderma virens Gv29-8]|uniref:Uncharacterized protein n=1 Tax=Hypocrea virens (strain Gv29-8 / FGSC 10586) TaxID=413071 RepID=G9MT76_HYPVG|nr:uncharacterized protein TRIVIDRAFT_216133 [Trichoderma virens Gv29-8]EHK23118.1 hypothetical protein TRIVIDRAFT_216133 [Trichoderma virens Gv29-8]